MSAFLVACAAGGSAPPPTVPKPASQPDPASLAGPRVSASYPYRIAILDDPARQALGIQLSAEVPGWTVTVDELGFVRSMESPMGQDSFAAATARITAAVGKLHARLGLKEPRTVRADEATQAWVVEDAVGWTSASTTFNVRLGAIEKFSRPHFHGWEIVGARPFKAPCRVVSTECALVDTLFASQIGTTVTLQPFEIPGHPGPPGGTGVAPVQRPSRPDVLRREDIALWPAVVILEKEGAFEAEVRLVERVEVLPRYGVGSLDAKLPKLIDAVTHEVLDGSLVVSWTRPEGEVLVFHDGKQDSP